MVPLLFNYIMPKEAAYQKLKRQLFERERDLIELSVNPNSDQSQCIKAVWKMNNAWSKMVWYGDGKPQNTEHVFKGLL